MITMPADAVGKKYLFVTGTPMPDGRGGVGLVQFAGEVLAYDTVCATIKEDRSNDTLVVSLESVTCLREEAAVKTVSRPLLIPGGRGPGGN